MDRDWRKRQRALINALREASLYQSELRLEHRDTGRAQLVRVHALLEDASTLVLAGIVDKPEGELALVVEDVDSECAIPVAMIDSATLRVRFDAVTPDAWRSRTRWTLSREATYVGRHVSASGSHPALAKILAFERGMWRLAVTTEGRLASGDQLIVRSTLSHDALTTFDIAHASEATVMAVRRPLDRSSAEPSVVPHRALELQAEITELGIALPIRTESFTATGFTGTTRVAVYELPQVVAARLHSSNIVCSIAVQDEAAGLVEGRIATCDRVAWYNFLTRAASEFDTRLRPEDAKPITRLMQESRNYTDRALRRRVEMNDAIAAAYELDDERSTTRFRWLARHPGGHVVGHLMGIQASPRVWAAIDNVGSQSHPGRWNATVVARWIRTFGELLEHLPDEPLIQWSFSNRAGVWTRFHERVRGNQALVYAENSFWNIVLDNLPDDAAARRGIEFEPLTSSEMFGALDAHSVDINVSRLLRALCVRCEPGSAFGVSFEREYGRTYRRLYRRVIDPRGAQYLLTFSNHPSWPSLNQGHNFHYLVPVGTPLPPTHSVLQAVRENVFVAGCDPFRVMYLGPESEHGTQWTDLLLTPAAMCLAAEAAEEF